MVDVHTIGAGGGSIASVDSAGMLRVGPKSAGARPGPICYGHGGSEPTITDANLVLGRLNPDRLLGVDHPVTLDHVRGAGSPRIAAKQAGVDFHPGKAETVHREACHLVFAQPRTDRQVVKVSAFLEQFPEAPAVPGADLDQTGKRVYRFVQIGHPAWRDLQRVGGEIVRQDDAVAVQYQTARRGHGSDRNAVVLSQRLEVLVFYHLQIDQPRHQ